MKGILLHGGHGTRLRPLTHTGPKQLLPIANKPMSEFCLESMKDAGITEIVIIIGGNGSNKVKEYYKNGKKLGLNISYIEQDAPKGIAHAISLCKDFVGGEKFLVFLGDNIIQKSIRDITEEFDRGSASATILLCEVDNPSRFGIADVKDGKIIKIMEKPKDPPTNLAVTGIYFLTPTIFDIISRLKPSWRNEYEITDALDMLLKEGHKITYATITDYWKDTGTPEDIINANNVILQKLESYCHGIIKTKNTSGNNMIGRGTVIDENAKIIGPVLVGENCKIESNCTIGPNVSIGDNSRLSKCHINDSIIMENCIIDCASKIKNSIIASNSKILSKENEENILLLGEGTKILL
ncbi:Glucose-1-phosphate thymidylyltransferase [metagenome]